MLFTAYRSLWALCALLFTAVALVVASNAQAATFSFASEDNDDGPTFQDLDPTAAPNPDISEGTSPPDVSGNVEVDFKVDTNGDTAGGVTLIPATFEFEGVFTSYGAVPVSGKTLHFWELDGSYQFTDLAGELLKSITFENAVLTALAPDATAITQTATIQANDPSSILSATVGPGLTGRGLKPLAGEEFALTDFSFTLSNLRTYPDGSPTVDVVDNIGSIPRPGEAWIAEGSYSATSSYLMPEPGSFVLLLSAVAMALVGTRRRR